MKKNSLICLLLTLAATSNLYPQSASQNTVIQAVSKAPVSYRVNQSGSKLHGYYKKGYDLTIYGDSSVLGFRADCDMDDDWSGADPINTTQPHNSFETVYKCVFNPHKLYGTVQPGNKRGQNNFDGVSEKGGQIGDLTLTYKLDSNNRVTDSVIGVLFDRGPHNQPGESSVATCKKFKKDWDSNLFVYIIFPGSNIYVKRQIGYNEAQKKLLRDPLNKDFEIAYQMMLTENESLYKRRKKDLLDLLRGIKVKTNFDNATPDEKIWAKQQPKNNDRNLNQ